MFPYGTCFSCVFGKIIIKVPQFCNTSATIKNSVCMPVLRHHCFDSVLNTSVLMTLNNLYAHIMVSTTSDAFKILVYSCIISIIKAYSCILKHYLGIFRIIHAYLAPCLTLPYSQACHILSPAIEICETLTWHIQNPRYTQNYVKAYSESCLFRYVHVY